jgi:gas vesicle protein
MKQSFVLGLASVILATIGIVSLSIAPAFAASTSINASANTEAQANVEDAKAEARETSDQAKESMNEAAENAEESVEAAQEKVKDAQEDAATSTEADVEVKTTSI